MSSRNCFCIVVVLAALVACTGVAVYGQSATLVGVGRLGGPTNVSRCYAVSSDGAIAVGYSLNANGKTEAFIWTSSDGMHGLGFLNPGNASSTAYGVDAGTSGVIHVTGLSTNGSSKDQAFHWSGNPQGTGTLLAIPILTGGTTSIGRALRIDNGGEIFAVGRSEKTGAITHAFRWKVTAQDLEDLGDIPGGHDGVSDARGVGWTSTGTTIIAGVGDSNWWVGGNRREAFRWEPSTMTGIKGLDWVCGRGFQVVAGANGIAETTASGDDIQVKPVGTTGLAPDTVVVSEGPNQWLNCRDSRGGDDELWPKSVPNQDTDTSPESMTNALSRDGRFSVGRCTYPDAGPCGPHPNPRLFEANLHDAKMKDGEPGNDHCGGNITHFPIGFAPGDNYSEAYGVSSAQLPAPSRQGLVVVGWSQSIGYQIQAGTNGIAESTAACDDVQEIPVGTTGLSSTAIVVSPGANLLLNSSKSGDDKVVSYGVNNPRAMVSFVSDGVDLISFVKDTRDLKAYLQEQGADVSGWELREARAVSPDGKTIAGWGLHNGVEEGWVARVNSPPPTGACCVQSGYGLGTCSVTTQPDCQNNLHGTYLGDSSVCGDGNANCDFCPAAWADTDGDNDVDQIDFARWQVCFAGPGRAIEPGCRCFDREPDGDVDQDDFPAFQACWSGPTVPVSPACGG